MKYSIKFENVAVGHMFQYAMAAYIKAATDAAIKVEDGYIHTYLQFGSETMVRIDTDLCLKVGSTEPTEEKTFTPLYKGWVLYKHLKDGERFIYDGNHYCKLNEYIGERMTVPGRVETVEFFPFTPVIPA